MWTFWKKKSDLSSSTAKPCLIVCLILALLPSTVLAAETAEKKDSRGLLSILRKLDFKRVSIHIQTQPELEKRLRARAIARLKKVGLEPVDPSYKGQVEAILVLTIDPIPVSAMCPGKVLYDHKFQLRDDVVLERDRDIRVEAITWSLAPASVSVVDIMPVEKLESDADWYIDRFIASYGLKPPSNEVSPSH